MCGRTGLPKTKSTDTILVNKRCVDGGCAPTGCCAVTITPDDQSPPIDICVATDAATCATPMPMGTFVAGGRCDGGLLGTCVPTLPNGDACTAPTQCQSGFCADGVCCDSACDQPLQTCNAPGQAGTCTHPLAPAPALSPLGLLVGLATVALVGAVALQWRARPEWPR